jgi:hypothetical protein
MAWSFAAWDSRQAPVGRHGVMVWLGWTVATLTGEFIGLALVAATGAAVSLAFGEPAGVMAAMAAAAMVLAGAIEGSAVGFMQSRVLCRELPALRARAWVRATALGAALAWVLGIAASTYAQGGLRSGATPSATAVLVVAVAGGLVLGAVLGTAQWWELRKHVRHAGSWIIANAFAWSIGLLVAVAGASSIEGETPLVLTAMIGALTGAVTGILVGALTGLALLPLLQRRLDQD